MYFHIEIDRFKRVGLTKIQHPYLFSPNLRACPPITDAVLVALSLYSRNVVGRGVELRGPAGRSEISRRILHTHTAFLAGRVSG
jgi:hypothetical protein